MATDDKPVDVAVEEEPAPAPKAPPTHIFERVFQVNTRGSTWLGEVRAGLVLFMTSAYILFLNPLILSGGAGFSTGMPSSDIVLSTAISTGAATATMGLVANYPWVVSVQLGTNTYFVNQVLQPGQPCGAHSTLIGPDSSCMKVPCECMTDANGNVTYMPVGSPDIVAQCSNTTNRCLGTVIPFEKALAATVLEGVAFVLICITGLRVYILRIFPKAILMAGAAGIGVFISFVGVKDMGLISANTYPTLLQLSETWPYTPDGLGDSGIGFNDCVMYFAAPPYGPVCPWLPVGGLIFTGILVAWNVSGAFIMGIFFTMFVSWIQFPAKLGQGGLVPSQIVAEPVFTTTLGALDFNWGDQTGKLVAALITFLYLDFIGSCITFVSLGQMMGLINERGDMPRANIAFLADGIGSIVGGLTGSSALTTYVESAAAVREGGRTGITALVCAVLFFISVFLWPLFSVIPSIATGPVLALIGVIIFMSSIMDIDWTSFTTAFPALVTILGMPFTNNIAYGVIGGLGMYIIIKFFAYELFDCQKNWPGYKLFSKREGAGNMFTSIPGWNADLHGKKAGSVSAQDQDLSLITLVHKLRQKGTAKAAAATTDDSAHNLSAGLKATKDVDAV